MLVGRLLLDARAVAQRGLVHCVALVRVPHSRSHAAVDSGGVYDSFAG